MAETLTRKIKDALRRLSQRTTVDQLKKRGVKKVNVVGLDRVVSLIEIAVHRSLKHRMMGFEGTGEIVDQARVEFLRLLHSNERLEKAHGVLSEEKSGLQTEVNRLRRELLELRGSLEARELEERLRAAEDDQVLVKDINALFSERDATSPSLNLLREKTLQLVLNKLEAERERLASARKSEHHAEVEILTRRIAKLSRTLEETERQLAKAQVGEPVDDGVASIYREVQGLSDADVLYERKKELMTSILEANIKLQGSR